MQYQFKFEKILSLKAKEKDEAQTVYQETVKRFEDAAEHLYSLLKKKEDLESYQAERLNTGLPIQEIRHHQHFVGNIEKTIDHYQKMVINARNHMNYQQAQLMEKNIEVKKYQRIKENHHLQFLAEEKYEEGRLMDEISIQQYMNREVR
ncbi:flagellar export protein FliJ [Mesobacillus zeae]|uniref:Flagellar FliJ protein n=1 Tax=Mesobacillus zeae TaxID=1917180 RepID=A0A398BCZ6_9BACI|nr:flagellar export protein FliJ [Mesobacillus zeae]RID87995.1 flagellar biosynthesis chaperone FliJ [Mesobacillus zeae]